MAEIRPTCINEGCSKPVAISSKANTGRPIYRTVCSTCHKDGYTKKVRTGIIPHKKTYCENIDGRLDYVCTATIVYSGQLELDHIDGNHFNNIPSNVQTLCKNCHSYKGYISGDFKK